jgi:hypothetical protein
MGLVVIVNSVFMSKLWFFCKHLGYLLTTKLLFMGLVVIVNSVFMSKLWFFCKHLGRLKESDLLYQKSPIQFSWMRCRSQM